MFDFGRWQVEKIGASIAYSDLVEEDGFEPSKSSTTDLQSAPFGHSGTPPYEIVGAGGRTRTPDLLITNQLLYQLSYTSACVSSAAMISLPEGRGFVKRFLRKRSVFLAQILDCYPYRDKQGERPRFFCLRCGQEQYSYDPPGVWGICRRCRRQERKREENAMTLQEMSTTYRAQAQRLRERIRSLEAAGRQAESKTERERLNGRALALTPIWRETRDLAVLLENYYERGYRRNDRYTL